MGYFSNYVTRPVIRWPFKVLSGANTIEGGNGPDPATSTTDTATILAASYIFRGTGVAVDTYNDLCPFLESALEAIHLSVFAEAATYTITLNNDGTLNLDHDGAEELYVYGTGVSGTVSTFDISQIGFDDNSYFSHDGGVALNSPDVCHYQWYSGIGEHWMSPEFERFNRSEKRLVNGKPIRILHSTSAYYEKDLWWDVVPGARVLDDRAADASYASKAGVSTNEDMTLENLFRYLDITETTNYPIPGQIYVFDAADPATAGYTGPYYVAMEESGVLRGQEPTPLEGFSFEMFEVKLKLVRVS
jgi:hypothetical protein